VSVEARDNDTALETYLKQGQKALSRLKFGSLDSSLHDLRVALRRLRTISKAAPQGAITARWAQTARKIAKLSNPLRDLEVRIKWLQINSKPLSGEERRLARQLTFALLEEYQTSKRRLVRRITPYWLRILQPCQANKLGGSVAALDPSLVRQRQRIFLRHYHKLTPNSSFQALHQTRIKAKQYRYVLEHFDNKTKKAAKVINNLKQLQDLLGDIHDLHNISTKFKDSLKSAPRKWASLYCSLLNLVERQQDEMRRRLGKFKARHAFKKPIKL